jgi:hypothetical protein
VASAHFFHYHYVLSCNVVAGFLAGSVIPWSVAVDPLAILIVGYGVMRVGRKIDHKLTEFRKDWEGEPARSGFPPRAGVMERLSMIEVAQVETLHRVDELAQKLEGN